MGSLAAGPVGAGPEPYSVLMVTEYAPARGGTVTQSRLHARELRRNGRNVLILTRRLRGATGSGRTDGVTVRRLGIPGSGRLAKLCHLGAGWLWLARHKREVRAVNVMLDADFAIAARLAGLGDLVIMTWVTRGDAPRLLGGLAGLARKALLRSVQHVVLTPSMENELHSLNVAHVSVVPVPVDTSWFHVPTETERSTARRSLGVSSGTVVLFVGHLTPRKGVERLVEAVAQLSEPEGGVRLFIVGGPPRAPDRAYAEQLLQEVERRLGSWAVFWGPRDDVRPFFHAADIFCLPSYSEGMPNCLLEAMASGVACVAPPSAGGAELLGGNLGVVPPSNSPEDLRMALAYLIEHAEERLAMGSMASGAVQVANRPERAVALYEALWDWDRTVAAARNGGAASKG